MYFTTPNSVLKKALKNWNWRTNWNLECDCTWRTRSEEFLDSKIWTDFCKASYGEDRFSSLHKKQIISTIQIFPTHIQFEQAVRSKHVQTLKELSSVRFNAKKASPTVAEIDKVVNGGFPIKSSDTSYLNKLTSIQQWNRVSLRDRKLGFFFLDFCGGGKTEAGFLFDWWFLMVMMRCPLISGSVSCSCIYSWQRTINDWICIQLFCNSISTLVVI